MLCPKCKTDNAHRSRRVSVMERVAHLVGASPYRCHQCSHRFRSFSHWHPGAVAPETRAEKEIATTRSSLRWKQWRLEIWIYGSALIVFVVLLYFLTRPPSISN